MGGSDGAIDSSDGVVDVGADFLPHHRFEVWYQFRMTVSSPGLDTFLRSGCGEVRILSVGGRTDGEIDSIGRGADYPPPLNRYEAGIRFV